MSKQRFFALFFAVLFLVTSSSLAIAFIVANVESKDNSTNSATTASSSGKKLSGFKPVKTVSTLKITDIKVGTGAAVAPGDTVTVDYTGAVAATGVIFQSGGPVSLNLSQVIAGWTEGIPGMKIGGERQLLIPASLAYGADPPAGSGIPANAALVFDVTLKSFKAS